MIPYERGDGRDIDGHGYDAETSEEELGGNARSYPPQQERHTENVSTKYHGVEQQPGVHDVVAVAELVDVPPALRYEDRVFEHLGGRCVNVSGEQHGLRRPARKQQEYDWPEDDAQHPEREDYHPSPGCSQAQAYRHVRHPEAEHAQPDGRQYRRMHRYGSPAEEREEAEMPPPPALHEVQGEEQRYGQDQEPCGVLVLRDTGCQLHPTLCTEGWIKMMWNRA